MTRNSLVVSVALGAFSLVHCGDEPPATTNSGTGQSEVVCDDSIDNDGDGAADCGDFDCLMNAACIAPGDTCGEVYACGQTCGANAPCVQACGDAGCLPARPLAAALRDCVLDLCIQECGNDPTDAACVQCIDTNCATELQACLADTCFVGIEDCTNGTDDDTDGNIDCNDADCAADPACTGTSETQCTNSVDDDNDGNIDCDDSDCAADPACQGLTCSEVLTCEQNCGMDANCLQACQDSGCATAQPLAAALTDCVLQNCANPCGLDPLGVACENCTNTFCQGELDLCLADTCVAGGEDCANGIDDDNDGFVDCDDFDCNGDPACPTATEFACANGIDDDSDGFVDCADSDCAGDPACQPTGVTCGEVVTCAQGCGADFNCAQTCVASGCATAQQLAVDLMNCVFSNCLNECSDPASLTCQVCMGTSCSTEAAACLADTCATAATENCVNQADDDGDGLIDCADPDCAADPACQVTNLSCGDVLGCIQGCGSDSACAQGCRDSGCASAQPLIADLVDCVLLSCANPCADPASPACESCTQNNCGTELSACLADTCATTTTENCVNQADDDGDGLIDCNDPDCGADPACQTTGRTCGEVLSCAEGCAGDFTCVQACQDSGCATAQTLASDLMACAATNCLTECADVASAACQACLGTSCGAELSACFADTCQ